MRTNDDRSLHAPVLHAATNPHVFGAARGALAVLLAAVLLVGSTGWFVYRGFASDFSSNAIDISGLGSQGGAQSDPDEEEKAPTDSFAGRPLNILVVGIDSREGQDVEGVGADDDVEGLRGDTTMLVHISADRSRVQIVSIPRDLVTDIPACTRTDGSVSGATTDMFNTAITIGANWGYDVASGIACTKATTEQLSGLTVDAFAVVDFTGFRDMVDALGGVWFELDEAAHDTRAGLDLPAGCQKLDGTQALAYARARYELGDGSDTERIGRQQQLVSAMVRELLSKNFVTDLPNLLSFVQQALGAVQPSQELADLNTSAGLLLSLASIDRANVQFLTMPSGPAAWDPDRVAASEPLATEVWTALAADQELPVGTQYTDGFGNVLTVAEPVTDQSGATGTDDGSGPADQTDGTDATEAPDSPAEQSGASDSGATVVEETTQAQCPPADESD